MLLNKDNLYLKNVPVHKLKKSFVGLFFSTEYLFCGV